MAYIEIVLRSDLCMGNGESKGNTVDTDICVDEYGLPYIPARRIKGCLRQAGEKLVQWGRNGINKDIIDLIFGNQYGKEGKIQVQNAYPDGYYEIRSFLMQNKKDTNVNVNDIVSLFTNIKGQTKLNNGVKVDNTLRFTRVLNHYDPLCVDKNEASELKFYCDITTEKEVDEDILVDICKATRHTGSLRNRGLGYVKLSYHQGNHMFVDKPSFSFNKMEDENSPWEIRYTILLESPITLPGYGELNTSIPARSMIGCMAKSFLGDGNKEDSKEFKDLFLNGTVRWSDITPVINGEISYPVPQYIMKLKNGGGKLINRFGTNEGGWQKLKPKTMADSYFSEKSKSGKKEYKVGSVDVHTMYHNRISERDGVEKMLYMQSSIDQGVIYGGKVWLPGKYVDKVSGLLSEALLRFGRSKSAQYANCRILSISAEKEEQNDIIPANSGDPVLVVLKSDIVLDDARYCVDIENIREFIAKVTGLENTVPEGYMDLCNFRIIGGYHTQWGMQKPHIPAVSAGSVFCFKASGRNVYRKYDIGEYLQEGFGKCVLYQADEIAEIKDIERKEIDRYIYKDKNGYGKRLHSVLLRKQTIEAMKEYASIIWQSIKREKKSYPVSKLRSLLGDSLNLEDLNKRIDNMKESDLSSDIKMTRKQSCKELVDRIYGENVFYGMSNNKKFSELIKRLDEDESTKEVVSAEWKVILDSILHKMHYDK